MRIMRFVLGAVFGAILATAVSWGGLYLYGRFRPAGSLFDTDPQSADLFFAIWLALAAVLAAIVGYLTSRR